MNKAEKAGRELREMEKLAARDSFLHRLSPLSKLVMTIVCIVVTVSFRKYDITGLFPMILVVLAGYQAAELPVSTCFRKLRIVMPLVCAAGLLNPFLDKEILMRLGRIPVRGGVISMLTLAMKGVFSLMASFLLVATTSIDSLCAGLRRIRFPAVLTSLLLLTFRYVGLLMEEVAAMTDAYHLRAPGQKGIHISAWGSFLGQLLLRSMDRAQALYESMRLRGFDGEFHYAQGRTYNRFSWLIAALAAALMILMRFVNLPALLAGLWM